MKLIVIALTAGLLLGCTQTPARSASSPPQPNANPSASPTADAPVSPIADTTAIPPASPSPVTDLPLSAVGISCRLPVVRWGTSGADYLSYQGGFVTFPSATYQADPMGVIHTDSLTPNFVTEATPTLHGLPRTGPPFHDLAKKRWVPAAAAQTSPDGAFYAYSPLVIGSNPETPSVIHVVDIGNGKERAFAVPTPFHLLITEFDGAGVYFSSIQPMGPPQGVWRLDIATGSVSQLLKDSGVAMVRGGYAWLNRIDPRDPEGPQTGHSGPRSNSVVRVNLSTGQETVWYYAPGQQVFWEGFDADGRPIVGVNPGPDFKRASIRVLSSPGDSGTVIYDGTGGLSLLGPQADGGRIWFGNERGIYVWMPGTGLQKVFAYTSPFPTSELMFPAGFCL